MGLMDKAKKFADNNRDKVADGVRKATSTVDSKTGGKHATKLRKLDDAAAKYAGRRDQTADQAETSAGTAPAPSEPSHGDDPNRA